MVLLRARKEKYMNKYQKKSQCSIYKYPVYILEMGYIQYVSSLDPMNASLATEAAQNAASAFQNKLPTRQPHEARISS